MSETIYLEVTYRKGKPLAAYIHLPGPADARSIRCTQPGPGLVVDYAADGHPIGIEIYEPSCVTIAQINELLAGLGFPQMPAEDLAPALAS